AVFRAMPPHSLFEPVRLVYDSAVFRTMPPHSLLRACSAGVRLCRVQSHATSQSLTSLFEVYDSAVFRAMPPHSLFEPVRLVCPAAFRAMPPHSLFEPVRCGVSAV
ncbi:hypothetical protein, partial [Coprococcus eutactus]|uniref:hypothetical protein n=1 Tax=Coprococcus eutactus TaxID=33043 RepID=UPI003B501944